MTDATDPPASGQSESRGAQEVTGQAQEKAQEAVGQAQDKAREAVGTAQDKVREQVDYRSTLAGEKVSGTAEDLRSVGEELRKQGKDGPAQLADRAAERTDWLGSYLKESDSDKLLADMEDFGRRQPLAVLAGGLIVGIATARFLKASSRGRYERSEERTRELQATIPSPPPAAPGVPAGPAPEGGPVPVEPAVGR